MKERDEQAMQSEIYQSLFPDNTSLIEAKEVVLREIANALTHKKALLHECLRMEGDLAALDSLGLDSLLLAGRHVQGPQDFLLNTSTPNTTAAVSDVNAAMQQQPMEVTEALMEGSPAVTATIPPAVTITAAKRGRQSSGKATSRSPRRAKGSTGAAMLQKATGSSSGGDPSLQKDQEDIEEKIRDIVRKALSVDSAAKSAEKERRAARSAERRRDKGGEYDELLQLCFS